LICVTFGVQSYYVTYYDNYVKYQMAIWPNITNVDCINKVTLRWSWLVTTNDRISGMMSQ